MHVNKTFYKNKIPSVLSDYAPNFCSQLNTLGNTKVICNRIVQANYLLSFTGHNLFKILEKIDIRFNLDSTI